jgi:hypothetical protein
MKNGMGYDINNIINRDNELVPNNFDTIPLNKTKTKELVEKLIQGDTKGVEKFLNLNFFTQNDNFDSKIDDFRYELKRYFEKTLYNNIQKIDFTINSKFDDKQNYAKGGAVKNERLHVNKGEDYEVRYSKPRPHRKGYKGLRNFEGGGEMDLTDDKRLRLRKPVMPERKMSEQEWAEKHNPRAYEYMSKRKMDNGGDISERKRYTVRDLKKMGFNQFKGDKIYYYYFEKDGNNYEFKVIPTIGINSGFISENDTTLALVKKYADGGGVGNGYVESYYNESISGGDNGYQVNLMFYKNLDDEDYFDEEYITTSSPKKAEELSERINKLGYEGFLPMNKYATGGGVGLIGNQSKIDMNHNGKIDAEDFKLLRSSMNGAWRNERKHVNHNEDYEVRYSKPRPSRTGYKGKRNFEGGGGISKFKMLSNKVARNYEGKSVKPQYQKEYGKVYSKEEAKEVGNKVAGKVKSMQKAESGASVKKGGKGSIMTLAKEIRKDGESWQDALKRAGQQLK